MSKEKENREIFESFLRKASKRLDEKKACKKRRLYIPSIDTEIVVRGLLESEIKEVYAIEDSIEQDKYSVYIAVEEPNLREVATELKKAGEIAHYPDVVDIFDMVERNEILKHVFELSGITSETKIRVVDVVDSTKN